MQLSNETLDQIINRMAEDCKKEAVEKRSRKISDNDNNFERVEKYQREEIDMESKSDDNR